MWEVGIGEAMCYRPRERLCKERETEMESESNLKRKICVINGHSGGHHLQNPKHP